HWPAVDVSCQIAQHEWRAAETAELVTQRLSGKSMLSSFDCGFLRRYFTDNARFGRGADLQRLADGGIDLQIDRRSTLWISRSERFSEPRHQFWIIVLPHPHSGLDGGKINRAVGEGQLYQADRNGLDERQIPP